MMRRPPLDPQCGVCPWFLRPPEFCDGALIEKPSCWWECEGKPSQDQKIRMRQLITFREYCLQKGITNEVGEWLREYPGDWVWDGEQWVWNPYVVRV